MAKDFSSQEGVALKNTTVDQIARLLQTIALVSADDQSILNELQSNLCLVLASVIRQLGHEVRPVADQIVENLLAVMISASKGSTVLEDAFLAVGSLVTAIEGDFVAHMTAFTPFLHSALTSHEENQMCLIAIGLVGDICRALKEQMVPFCAPIMKLLMQDLRVSIISVGLFLNILEINHLMESLIIIYQSETAKPDIKPVILSCFGDVALAITGDFEPYLVPVMTSLAQAAQSAESILEDSEMYEYSITLREGILEAYAGIAQGLNAGGKAQLFMQHVRVIFSFCENFAAVNRPESANRGLLGLLGYVYDIFPLNPHQLIYLFLIADFCFCPFRDIARIFRDGQFVSFFNANWVKSLLKEVNDLPQASEETKKVAEWSRRMIFRSIPSIKSNDNLIVELRTRNQV